MEIGQGGAQGLYGEGSARFQKISQRVQHYPSTTPQSEDIPTLFYIILLPSIPES